MNEENEHFLKSSNPTAFFINTFGRVSFGAMLKGTTREALRAQKTLPVVAPWVRVKSPNGRYQSMPARVIGLEWLLPVLMDGAGEPRMGSGGGRLCVGTRPVLPWGRFSARLSEFSRERGGETSAVLVVHSPCQRSDSSSASGACSLRSVSSQRPKRGTFKRPRLEEGRGPSSNEQEAPAPKIPTASREAHGAQGRGKRKGSERLVPTAQAEPTEADSSEMEVSGGEGSVGQNDGEVSLRKTVMEALRMVAGQKSQNAPKRTAGRQMTVLQKELGEMRREMARLTASNTAMEAELRSAKAELAAVRGGRGQPSQSAEADMIGLVRREMAAFQQRFDVLESRILRPPLAASQAAPRSFAAAAATNSGQSSRSAQGQPPARELVASPAQAPTAPAAKAPKGRRRRGTVNQPAVAPTGVEPTPVSDFLVDGGEWQVVGEAKKRPAQREERKAPGGKRQQRGRRRSRHGRKENAPLPASAMLPDAVKRGVTYGDVLAKLKAAVNPAEYGAPDGFSMKVTATGARLLEVPGAASGPSADALADKDPGSGVIRPGRTTARIC
ncbi:hypothetical protein SFRURICE_020329 [Spodoptera frugiperda]|nr:hypothetical protein SFRURICE_020329 [Spodoptera frugiperda]